MRAGLREQEGRLVPRANSTVAAAAYWGLGSEPVSVTWPALARLSAPILLLAASESVGDEGERAALDRFRAAVPGAEVRTVAGGHDLFADTPAEVAAVADWLKAHVSARPYASTENSCARLP